MAMMGIAFSLIPAVMWPSVAYVVEESKLGTAYGLMTMVQNIGLFGFNLMVGALNDHCKAGAGEPGRLPRRAWLDLLGPRVLGADLRVPAAAERDGGRTAHGLETITARG